MPSPIESAYALVNAGHAPEGRSALEAAAARGDANCWVELGVWHLEGRLVPRDLKKSRECFRQAAATGHESAAMVYIALLASGVGGPRDWPGALALLARAAKGDPNAARQYELLERMDLTEEGDPHSVPDPRILDDAPEVRLFPRLLREEECDYLIDLAKPLLAPSVVVDPATGRMAPNPVRTSDSAAFPWVDEIPFIHAINRRIAAASATQATAGEPLQVLRYRPGQEYRPHHDALQGADNQRILTVLVYLNEGYGGGETEFLRTGLKIAGRTGDGLMFRNADDLGRPDPNAQHAGLPVTSGEKLLASRWIRQRRFGPV